MIRLGILGYPLSHSLSPVFQALFLKSSGLEGTYERFEVPPEALHFWLGAMPHVQGLNVTILHKVTVLNYCQTVSHAAQTIGAVNTLVVTPEGLHGENTDVLGFLSPLQAQNVSAKHAIVLGTGGASRAVLVGLTQLGVTRCTVVTRNVSQGQDNLQDLLPRLSYRVVLTDSISEEALSNTQLVVNTTPVGMTPNRSVSPLPPTTLQALPPDALVYDLVYNPLETQLLKDAKACSLKTQDGLDMLIAQGAASFNLWTSHKVQASTLAQARTILTTQLQTV